MYSATFWAAVHKGGQPEVCSTSLAGRLQPPIGQQSGPEGAPMGLCNKLHQIPAFSIWPLAASVAASAISHCSFSFSLASVTCAD
jgi:hypothetical protein